MNIRRAEINDAEQILNIYGYYIENTSISFEYDVPSTEEFQDRICNVLKKYPYIVMEDNNEIIGYAYAGVFKARAAYDHCCETTIYVDKNCRGKGYGRKLYEALEAELKKQGIINLYACIASPIEADEHLNNNSERFHKHMGYECVGTFHKCGFKFDKWINMIWMEKIIGEYKG